MISISINELCLATKGTFKSGYLTSANCKNISINNVSIDTRTLKDHDLFIALKGPSFNAHKLLQSALDKGAAVLLVEADNELAISTENIVIEVEDTRIALGLLSSYIKQKLSHLKCAAITGSNGKTTCKELLSAILAVHCGDENNVLATAGNFNNDIGLPLTLLRLEKQHKFAVVELGANHIGEIAYTSSLAKPNVALVNNIMKAHLEGFGSLEGIASAKAEIWSSLSTSGIAVVNLDADFSNKFVQELQKNKQKLLSFSKEENNQTSILPNVFATNIHFNELGQASFTLNYKKDSEIQISNIQLNLPGKHNISNALAASTMALALGCSLEDVQSGLHRVQQVSGRVNSAIVSNNLTVIDDTYNANSASVIAGIDLLVQHKSTHLLVLGDMGELGEFSEQEHKAIGQYAQKQGIEKLFTVGSLSQQATNAYNAASKTKNAEHFFDKEKLKSAVKRYLSNETSKVVVLVKGSRSAKMEEIVAFINDEFST